MDNYCVFWKAHDIISLIKKTNTDMLRNEQYYQSDWNLLRKNNSGSCSSHTVGQYQYNYLLTVVVNWGSVSSQYQETRSFLDMQEN